MTIVTIDAKERCTQCPFWRHIPDDNPYGGNGSSECRIAGKDFGTSFPKNPDWCPLRSGDVIVRLSP